MLLWGEDGEGWFIMGSDVPMFIVNGGLGRPQRRQPGSVWEMKNIRKWGSLNWLQLEERVYVVLLRSYLFLLLMVVHSASIYGDMNEYAKQLWSTHSVVATRWWVNHSAISVLVDCRGLPFVVWVLNWKSWSDGSSSRSAAKYFRIVHLVFEIWIGGYLHVDCGRFIESQYDEDDE